MVKEELISLCTANTLTELIRDACALARLARGSVELRTPDGTNCVELALIRRTNADDGSVVFVLAVDAGGEEPRELDGMGNPLDGGPL